MPLFEAYREGRATSISVCGAEHPTLIFTFIPHPMAASISMLYSYGEAAAFCGYVHIPDASIVVQCSHLYAVSMLTFLLFRHAAQAILGLFCGGVIHLIIRVSFDL